MKVRIGFAAGAGVADSPVEFLRLVDALDDLGYDSVWIPDIVTTATMEPLAALGVAAGRRPRLKFGTHLIIPGRNPVMLAKQLATLDQLSQGRVLLNGVLGLRERAELQAQGVEAEERTSMLEESLHVMRTLWSGEPLTFHGRHFDYDDLTLAVRPMQQPLEVWLGGQVPAALRRCGRHGDGWMPGLCTPAEAAAGKAVIDAEAERAGRIVDPEHFGVNLSWADAITERVRTAVAARRPAAVAEDLIAVGTSGLVESMQAFLAVGFSKFVIRPLLTPNSWADAAASVSEVLEQQSVGGAELTNRPTTLTP